MRKKSVVPIGEYARERAAALLGRLEYEAGAVSKNSSAEAIHDLRVSIRRFSQCLRAFANFFPAGEEKRVRRGLKKIMGLAGEARNRDIAAALLKKAGVPRNVPIYTVLARERRAAYDELVASLRLWKGRGTSQRWKERLGL
jgi:CHAD domain-containing protein